MGNTPTDLLEQRIAELRDQLKRDQRFLDFLENKDFSAREFVAVNAVTRPVRTPAHDSFARKSMAVRKFFLGQNAFLLPALSSGISNVKVPQRIGIICDNFLFKSFEGLANFVPITPGNYADVEELDLVLLVSTWRGITDEEWAGVAQRNSPLQEHLLEVVIPHFKSKDIPVVFYSKEDPPNYQHFLPFARVADVIFTSAEEMLPKYREECPNAVHHGVLPFGVNPRHHSPLGHRNGTSEIIPFAGSWFNHKYHSRGRWGSQLFTGVATSNTHELLIFDRNSHLNRERYFFPIEFAGAILPAIGHDELLELLRLSDIAINLNSVQDSMTMFANRVVELQATGTLVLSNYNAGINSLYPQVHTVNSARDIKALLETLNQDELRRAQADGIRDVFTNDLTHFRIDSILESVGFSTPRRDLEVVAVIDAPDERLKEQFARQSFGSIPVVSPADLEARSASVDVVVDVSAELDYGPHYVQDLVNAFRYSDAPVAQKVLGHTADVDLQCQSYADSQTGSGLSAKFVGEYQVKPQHQRYTVDNFSVTRRGVSRVVLQETPEKPAFSVVVPIYNNGRHLENKCFASLRRSSMFTEMEIIFVDDGSTDLLTHEVIDRLAQQYKNVKVYKFPSGGSGSASRPRNKGLDLATAQYVTYLDPDNEALNDGYTALWTRLQSSGANFAIGNMSRWRSGHSVSQYTSIIQSRLGTKQNVIELTPESIIPLGFQPMSIQALMAQTDWLRGLGISQPVGAVGQDSYFFQQMFYYADSVALVQRVIHTYYGEVADSVVNTVSARFFEKYRPLEEARSAWLRQIGLLEEYKDARLENFFGGWYLNKLEAVADEERETAINTILDLVDYYGEYAWTEPAIIEFLQDQGRLTATQAAEMLAAGAARS